MDSLDAKRTAPDEAISSAPEANSPTPEAADEPTASEEKAEDFGLGGVFSGPSGVIFGAFILVNVIAAAFPGSLPWQH